VPDGACWLDVARLVFLGRVMAAAGVDENASRSTRHLSLLGMRWVDVLSRAREKRNRNGMSYDGQGTQAFAPDAAMVAPE